MATKPGRNDPCPCGSGKKYKRCCLLKEPPPERHPEPEADGAPAEGDLVSGLAALQAMARGEAPPKNFGPKQLDNLLALLPKRQRKEFAPVLQKLRMIAATAGDREDIDAAIAELQTHADARDRLSEDRGATKRRAQALVREDAFAGLRFSTADLHRAFETVGYVDEDASPEAMAGQAKKVIGCLVEQDSETPLASRLLALLPGLVRAERWEDAWLVHASAIEVLAPGEAGVGPLVMELFAGAMSAWQDERGREQQGLAQGLGLDLEKLKGLAPRDQMAAIQSLASDPSKLATAEAFLQQHPELHAQLVASCGSRQEAAMGLLQRPDARGLLLDDAEVRPWVPAFIERADETSALARGLAKGGALGKRAATALQGVMVDLGREMAQAILTPERRARLADRFEAYLEEASEADRDEVLTGVQGALLALRDREMAPENSGFLVALCCTSLVLVGEAIVAEEGVDDGLPG